MPRREDLTLHEEIVLLALKNEKGTTGIESRHDLAMGGAILAELLLLGRIEVQQEKKKRFAVVRDAEQTGNALLDESLERIAGSRRRQQLRTWVSRLSRTKKLKRRTAVQLCRKGILREREEEVLLIFRRKVYPELDPRPEKALVERLRRAMFDETSRVDPRTAALVALAFHGDLLKNVFEKKKLKGRKKRIETLIEGDLVGAATKEAVEDAKAAAAAIVVGVASG